MANSLMVVMFFVSGATALVGEVVWMRMLGLTLGNTVWAATTVVAAWMGGMAIGSRIGAWLSSRTRRHLRLYGLAEGGIALFFAISPHLHSLLLDVGSLLGEDLQHNLTLAVAQRFGLALVVLSVPTVLMGITLPLLTERIRGARVAGRVSNLYAANTLGAVAGVLLAAYLLLPSVGESGSLAFAALTAALIGAIAVAFEQHIPAAQAIEGEGERPTTGVSTPWAYLLVVTAIGFSALAAELIWVRILVLYFGSRVYSFAVLLAVYLFGLAVGSYAIRFVSGRVQARAALTIVQLLTAAALLGQIALLGHTPEVITLTTEVLQPQKTFVGLQMVILAATAALFLPVSLLFGAAFPLCVGADPKATSAGGHAGRVAAANTIGAVTGSIAATFIMVPTLGTQRSLLVLILIHLGAAVALSRRRVPVAIATVVALITVALAFGLPRDWVIRQAPTVAAGDHELLEVEESLSATVLVKRYQSGDDSWLSLELNSVNVAGSSPALLAIQQLQGQIPLMQVEDPKSVLHIGFGSGGTCWAVSRHPVETIDVVEISPEVLEAADTYFADINRHVLADPRVNVIINDGRNFLLATERKWDAILSDSIHPVYAGNGSLYTLEYFKLCRKHLNPGGVVSMWLPTYSLTDQSYLRILASFHEVFPKTTVWYDVGTPNEFTVVTGQVEAGPPSLRWEMLGDPRLQESFAIARIHSPEDLAMRLLIAPGDLGALLWEDPPLHIDDLPFVEYTSGRVLSRNQSWMINYRILVGYRTRSDPFPNRPGAPWPEVMERRDQLLMEHLHAVRQRFADQG